MKCVMYYNNAIMGGMNEKEAVEMTCENIQLCCGTLSFFAWDLALGFAWDLALGFALGFAWMGFCISICIVAWKAVAKFVAGGYRR